MSKFRFFLLSLLLVPLPTLAERALLHHDLTVKLQPEQKIIVATDNITLPQAVDHLTLELHAGLEPEFSSSAGRVEVISREKNRYWQRYRLQLSKPGTALQVKYKGSIHHALSSGRAEQARGFRSSPGIIDQQGVFLSYSSIWYPQIAGYDYLTYSLQVELPAGWSSVSQGKRVQRERDDRVVRDHWQIDKPQEEIYLIAAEFFEYSRDLVLQQSPAQAQVFLRESDQKLADKYLDATVSYLKMYEQLLGAYPYSKFALVENFWQTGFGMPSFTLLGSRVIRLPFIINSSYPHEILHNWWGNGVYIDFATGNWSEGLTAYLADHLIKEQQGQGANYRQQSLQKYRDYAAKKRDFPLTEFKSRHSSATEAVGYGKTLMLFHMLRNKLGDDLFIEGLQNLYRDYQFRTASFNDVKKVFEQTSDQSLARFFNQWVERTGAPELQLTESKLEKNAQAYRLELTLAQVQPGDAYELDIPLAVSLAGQRQAQQFVVQMSNKQQSFSQELDYEPTRVDIDPQFDLFRKLAVAETPPAFTQVFGANELLVVTPSATSGRMQAAWQAFADDVSHMGPERIEIVRDADIDELPAQQAVMVLGWNNRFASQLQQELAQHPVKFEAQQVKVGQGQTNKDNHVSAWVTRIDGADKKSYPRAFIAADQAAALPGLGRKIPHYHKYSYLAFEGDEPQNRLKGRWPVTDSPMSVVFSKAAEPAQLKKSAALVEPVSPFDPERMLRTVKYLSDEKMQGRGMGSAGLEQAAEHIATAFKQFGLRPAGDNGSYYQQFSADDENGNRKTLKNVVAVIPGRHSQLSSENLVLGAHYDHLGLGWPDVREDNKGKIHHGADDNASGVAVMLELARIMGRSQPDRNILFVAFSGEEAGRLGSKHYAKHATNYPVSKSIGMLNLDTVGRLFDKQLMVLGSDSATEWPHIFRGIGFVTGIQTVMVSEPLDASDQISFHEAGVPAVQLFSGPTLDYHRPGDTADKIDADGLVKVAEVSKQVLDYLASREEPMTITLANAKRPVAVKGPGRKVSLGTIPDFTFQGEGYRLDGVSPGSPAEQAGLQKLDIIVQINQQKISGLRDVSKALKSLAVGDEIEITYLRNNQKQTTMALLISR